MRRTLLAAAVLLLGTMAAGARAQSGEKERMSLAGLRGVYVVVSDIKEEVQRAGLRKEDVLTDVELRLRRAGVPVLSRAEWANDPAAPMLYVDAA